MPLRCRCQTSSTSLAEIAEIQRRAKSKKRDGKKSRAKSGEGPSAKGARARSNRVGTGTAGTEKRQDEEIQAAAGGEEGSQGAMSFPTPPPFPDLVLPHLPAPQSPIRADGRPQTAGIRLPGDIFGADYNEDDSSDSSFASSLFTSIDSVEQPDQVYASSDIAVPSYYAADEYWRNGVSKEDMEAMQSSSYALRQWQGFV